MGERHQVFLIARVRAKGAPPSSQGRLRCIFAWHHQWCYGCLPLIGTRRFITLLQQPENMEVVQYELKSIQGQWEEQGKIENRFPCPFLSFLLACAWGVNLEPIEDEGAGRGLRTSSGSILSHSLGPDMGSCDGDNNDGITVIDVTDPAAPAYCFAAIYEDGLGLAVEGACPEPNIPLSAEQYCRAFYPPQDLEKLKSLAEDNAMFEDDIHWEESVRSVIAALNDIPVIKLASLAEAWPWEYELPSPAEKEETIPHDSEAVSANRWQDPILEASMRTILDSDVAEHSDGMEQVYDILTREDYRPRVLAKLRRFLDIPPASLPLLSKLLANDEDKGSLDLLQFPLSAEQILQVIAEPQSLDVLNLSGNPHLTADDLLHILPHLPKLRRLVLLDCPALSNKDFSTVFAANPALFGPIEAVIHPFFLTFVSEIPYKSRFAIYWFGSTWLQVTRHILPTFHPARIVQVLFDLLQPLLEEKTHMLHEELSIQSALSGAVRRPGQPWGAQSVVYLPRPAEREVPLGEEWPFGVWLGENRWAFVRQKPGRAQGALLPKPDFLKEADGPFEIFDLRGFIEQACLPGSDPRLRPSKAAEEQLQGMFEKMKKFGFQLLTLREVTK